MKFIFIALLCFFNHGITRRLSYMSVRVIMVTEYTHLVHPPGDTAFEGGSVNVLEYAGDGGWDNCYNWW